MIYQGVRRCELCHSEILGRAGADVCFICRLIGEDPDVGADDNSTHAPNVLLFPQRHSNAVLSAFGD